MGHQPEVYANYLCGRPPNTVAGWNDIGLLNSRKKMSSRDIASNRHLHSLQPSLTMTVLCYVLRLMNRARL